MESSNLESLLEKGAESLKIDIEQHQIKQFISYMEILKEWNKKINLTAIENDNDIAVKHFIDSMTVLPYIKNHISSLIDIGTGAGFPGIPVKVMLKDIEVTLLDSLEKRVKFLNEVINIIKLKKITAFHGRAEEYGRNIKFREKFDYAVARAVANLPVLLEYCLPFVKINGTFIAMKGRNIEEIEEAKKALEILGGEIQDVKQLVLPLSDIKRNIIIIRKLRQTPTKYPRKAGKPSKTPLK